MVREECVSPDMNSQRVLISLYNLLSASLLPQTGGQSDGMFFEKEKFSPLYPNSCHNAGVWWCLISAMTFLSECVIK